MSHNFFWDFWSNWRKQTDCSWKNIFFFWFTSHQIGNILFNIHTFIIMEGDLNDETRWNPLSSILGTNFGDDFLIKIFPTLEAQWWDFSSPLIFHPKNFHLMILHGWLSEFGGPCSEVQWDSRAALVLLSYLTSCGDSSCP